MFALMLAAIEGATIGEAGDGIFSDSMIGQNFAMRWCARQRRVRVRVLIDAWGSFLCPEIFEPLVAAVASSGGSTRFRSSASISESSQVPRVMKRWLSSQWI
jgi:hypothetical protein